MKTTTMAVLAAFLLSTSQMTGISAAGSDPWGSGTTYPPATQLPKVPNKVGSYGKKGNTVPSYGVKPNTVKVK